MEDEEDKSSKQKNSFTAISVSIIAVIGAIMLLAACPLAIIWAINGLFNLTIPYDFFHWSCAAVLLIMLRADLSSPSKD